MSVGRLAVVPRGTHQRETPMVGYARAWRVGVVVVCALLALPVSVLAGTPATWSTTGRPLASLDGPGVLLPTGKVLAVDVNGRGELYDPRAQTWALTGSTTVRGPLTLLANGHVLVVGDLARVAQEYNPQTGTWTTVGAPLAARTLATFTPLPNGKILIAGGVDGS